MKQKISAHSILIIPEEMKNILLTLGAILCFWACQTATSTYQGPSRGHHFASEASEEGYINEIFNIDVLTSCAMSLKNETPSRLTYGCLCTTANGKSENYWISVDWGTTIEDATSKEYAQQAKGVIARQFNNVKEMNFQNLPALLYDQREGATLIRHLNFWYKGNVYDVKFASFPSDDFDMRASNFFNRITLK